jgi:hypothetical protein
MTRVTFALIACALLIAGCSSKSKPSEPESPATTVHGSLAECLHANGVPKSAGPAVVLGRPDGVDEAIWDKAMAACSTLGPGPGPAGG